LLSPCIYLFARVIAIARRLFKNGRVERNFGKFESFLVIRVITIPLDKIHNDSDAMTLVEGGILQDPDQVLNKQTNKQTNKHRPTRLNSGSLMNPLPGYIFSQV
jgi:hypothetical protein